MWLTGIVLLSVGVRIALARRMVAPWIMVDELVYSELAKSFAAHGSLAVRGVPTQSYGFVYPVVIAPAWRLFASIPDAYMAAKAINAVVMSLAAVPAYFLARRVLGSRLALVAAALTVMVPSMLYTGTLMTENVFYPLFLVCVLVLVLTLERPSPGRQILLVALCGLAYATRAQAVALVAAVVSAPVLFAFTGLGGLRRGLRPFATLYGILAAGGALVLLGTVARGRSVGSLLGAYQAATSGAYSTSGILHYFVYHVAELDLYLGIVPFAALLALWASSRDLSPAARAFAAASLPVVVWLVVEVAAFASVNSLRIEERNMFYVAPLALIALLGLASEGVVTRRRWPILAAALTAAVLPVFIPYQTFIKTSAVSDTLALLPWWWVQDHWITLAQVRWATLGAACLTAALIFLPRRYALVLPALVGAYFIATTTVAENGRHGIHLASLNSLWAGIEVAHPDWIDRAVGHNASVDYLRTDVPSLYTLWENEFFNRSLRRVYSLTGPSADVLPETLVSRRPSGELTANDHVVRVQYLLTDTSVDLKGTPVARDRRLGMVLYRINGPIVLLTNITGLYPNTTPAAPPWSTPTVTYTRLDCTGGELTVKFESDPSLYKTNQTVTAREASMTVGRIQIAPKAEPTLTIPIKPLPHTNRCVVQFEVAKTLIPARIQPGSTDTRPLGTHFLNFNYKAANQA